MLSGCQPKFRSATYLAVALLAILAVQLNACQPTQSRVDAPINYSGPRPELQTLRNAAAPLGANVWSGAATPQKTGTKLKLLTRAAPGSYLTLYYVGTSGRPSVLMENNPVMGAAPQKFPGADDPSDFVLTAPAGIESFILVATTAPFSPNFAKGRSSGMSSTLEMTYPQLLERLSAVTQNLPPNSWDISILNIETRT